MATYVCKCGRQVQKAASADNTGNRDTAGCTGCPYLLPWGPDKYIEGQGYTKDVQGYECRMSPTISYTTTYRGQANDKCTLHILSLDLDFLDEVQAWIYDNAADTLSAGFSRGSMRGIDFSDKGRYSLSISCTQNKKGMAAKAALIEHFFTGGRVRKDMTLAQEKAHILAAIQRGKEQAQRKDQPMKKQNDRCPLQQECERTCKVIGHERDCDYYVNNRYSTGGIPDQDELLTEEELRQEREWEEQYLASLSAEPDEPVVYQNEYGTLFAVREHKGAPALMCKAKEADSWALSGVLAAVQGEAYTAADQQEVLDEYARTHGWQPLEGPASAEPPEIVDECSDLDLPYPGDVYRSAKGGQLYKIGELTNGKKTCYLTMRCNVQGGTWVPANSSVYPNLSDAQGEFEAWIRTKQLEPVAPTGAAAATTDASAAPEPPQAAETTTTSESGEGASTPLSESSSTQVPNSSPAPAFRADAGAAEQSLSAAGPASLEAPLSASSAFDYSGLPTDTAERLQNLARRAAQAKQRYILDMMEIVVEAHRELCDTVVQPLDNGRFSTKENTFAAWCASIGVGRSTAYNLLQVQALMDGSTPEEQEVLADAPAKLLYAAAKPSAPAELVQAVKDGDITTNKQYQEALARIRTLENQNASLLHSYETERGKAEAADRRAEEAERMRQDAQQKCEEAITHIEVARNMQIDTARERDEARRREAAAESRARAAEHDRDEACKERDGARDALQAARLRGDRLKAENDDLKARPIEAAVVDEDELARRVEERVRRQMADREADRQQQAARNAEDAILLLGRQINTAWQMVRPFLAQMEENRRVDAVDRINKQWAQTQKEIMQCL